MIAGRVSIGRWALGGIDRGQELKQEDRQCVGPTVATGS
jgi:hypothetical protein